MLLVKLDERDYIPFLLKDAIRLKDSRSNHIQLREGSLVMVQDLESGRLDWSPCTYRELRDKLSSQASALNAFRKQVVSGEWEILEEIRREVLV